MTPKKPRILFVYSMEPELEPFWQDGLWAALKLLEKDFIIEKHNLYGLPVPMTVSYPQEKHIDFILGWGAFGSNVDIALNDNLVTYNNDRTGVGVGLCLAGYAPTQKLDRIKYNVMFYENNWALNWLKPILQYNCSSPRLVHAFGVNTQIFKPAIISKYSESFPLWDYMTVGSFSYWKRQTKLIQKTGRKLAIGQIQRNNLNESMDIIMDLLMAGVAVSDMVPAEVLAKMYQMSGCVYIPAEEIGGGERSVLEARACERPVEVESDNMKLQELLTCPIWDEKYYAYQLKQGILECLK